MAMELTIDELARTVEMTARNIREWQTNGLLEPPLRRGRIGVYTQDHVARIKKIKKLRADGFPLDLIRRYLKVPGSPASEVHRVAAGVLTPFSPSEHKIISRDELSETLGAEAEATLTAIGIVTESDAATVTIDDPALLELLVKLVRLGIPTAEVAATFAAAHRPLHEIAALLAETFRRVVWQPFVAAGLPAEGWQAVADRVTEARSVAVDLQTRLAQHALDEVINEILVQEAHHLNAFLDLGLPDHDS